MNQTKKTKEMRQGRIDEIDLLDHTGNLFGIGSPVLAFRQSLDTVRPDLQNLEKGSKNNHRDISTFLV
ncbi:7629_t:CDS:2 [Diversispora eburnea]|uniref:7629_t:CDS:1 n=1 Tax=Diversispora eburnea TaxID=1213867 RepID=A0A9N8ZBG9_9GLOM|nr:7629_t:CDS:2 [Diversispora eburnea]